MYNFPVNPDSVLVVHNGEEVFVSFHFVPPSGFTPAHLALFLEGYLKAEAAKEGYVAVDMEDFNNHGA